MADEQKPMPQWIKQSRLPESTKQYFYELWLNGDISPKAPAQDWGAITDIADAIRKITFKKPKVRTDTFPKQSLEEVQETASEIAQRRNDLRLAISETDGVDVVLGDEILTLDEAIKQEQNLTIVNNQYKNAIDRRRPSSERAKDPDSNLQVGLETAQSNADSAYAEMLQEITAFPETSQPYRDRYFASLKILDQAETKALDKGLTIPKTVTVEMGLPTRDITAPSTTAEALRKPVTTRLPSGVAAQQGMGATAVTPVEDRAEQARFGRMKTGELRPGTKVTPTPTGEPAPTETVVPTTAVVPAAPVVDVAKRKAFVTAQLTARGLENTPANRDILRKEYIASLTKTEPVVDAAKRKEFVNTQLVARGLENTPANRDVLRKEYVASLAKPVTVDGKPVVGGPTDGKTTTVSNAWETTFRQTFPARAWLLDLDRTKYPQLFQLLNTAMSQEWYKTPAGEARFIASLDATDFYKEISNSKQLKVIQSVVGTLGFEGSDFTKFVSDSINFKYEGDILKQKVYEQVFKKDDAGNYINPTALERTKKSADYIRTQNIAKAFFGNPSDDDIEQVLTGQMLAADYERQQRVFAGQRYGHLKDLLDQGMTMKSIAANYQTSAARLLELDENAIDMSTGAFEQAVTFGEEGKKRLMTNSEWEKLLRTDPQYGWEKTNNAKDEARSLSANIAQAFGRIL